MSEQAIRVLCVDDNDFVAEAIRRKLSLDPTFEWAGWLPEARDLVKTVKEKRADVVLLDIDMPGKDSFEALAELAGECPDARVIMLSGYVRADYIDRAVEAGAWGYVSKNENTETILAAIQQVAKGGFAMGSEVEAELKRRRVH
ncbi:MAG TPA: response regulator transcription factor [Phycisphaerales bacterium]|nr:response regulator transcription factor [Phycisphaerales bacterium]